MESTLLLAASYEPIKVISWRRAITLSFLGKVDVLEAYESYLHSPSVTIPMPAVVKLNRFVRHLPRRVKFCRQNLYTRDNFTCQYCHRSFPTGQLTYDHVVPRSKGGKTTWDNVVTACSRCNLKKGNKLPHQINARLLAEPQEPDWLPVFPANLRADNTPEVWRDYLDWG